MARHIYRHIYMYLQIDIRSKQYWIVNSDNLSSWTGKLFNKKGLNCQVKVLYCFTITVLKVQKVLDATTHQTTKFIRKNVFNSSPTLKWFGQRFHISLALAGEDIMSLFVQSTRSLSPTWPNWKWTWTLIKSYLYQHTKLQYISSIAAIMWYLILQYDFVNLNFFQIVPSYS